MLASACGGKKAGSSENVDRSRKQGVESGLADAGKPVRGGKVVYGLEAETDGGFCLTDAELAISGIQVARTLYDTLTVPNDKGEYVPYLAKSIDHNPDYTEWTVKLREGVKFHDGTALTADIVKENFDDYAGKNPDRPSTLFSFVFKDLKSTEVVDRLTVKFTTTVPWIAFPSFLYSSGRTGIMAAKQLHDKDHCDIDMVGTGPFELKQWKRGQRLVATANPDYWAKAPDGKPYPYLSEIEYRPIIEETQRVNALQAGDIQALHTSSPTEILALRDLVDSGKSNLLESNKSAEVNYLMINSTKPPLDDLDVRKALQLGIDNDLINQTVNSGLPQLANGPFAPGNLGSLKDTGVPKHNVADAKALVKKYQDAHGGQKIKLTLTSTNDAETVKEAELTQSQAKDIGIEITLKPVDQTTQINLAIGKGYQLMTFRNHPGGDPDTQYVWWKSDSAVNFGGINDPKLDRLLDAGRSETDPAKRKQIYEDLNREFAAQAWNLWTSFTPWAVATAPNVHGIYGPNLPDGSKPSPGLAVGHSVLGMWTVQK